MSEDHESQEREVELLLSRIKDILFVISFDYEILFTNNEASRNFKTNLVGKTCYEALLNRDRPCDICAITEFKEKDVDSYGLY